MPARKYQPSVFDNIENIEKYVVGGFHPVHIGDTLDDGRYRIVHKLGYGGFATVWLARDHERNGYVALKIITAEESKDCAELNIYRYLKDTTFSHPGRKTLCPSIVVEAICDIKAQYVTENTLIIDFGQSFFLDSPPSGGIETTWSYRAPEAIFHLKASIYSDMWALACTIFEIRAAEELFEAFFSDREEILVQLVQTLGKLPKHWWYAWEDRLTCFDEDGKPKQKWENDRVLASLHPLIDQIKDIGSEDASSEDASNNNSNHGSTGDVLDHESHSGGLFAHAKNGSVSNGRAYLSAEEVATLHDLLSKILTYAPEDCITAKEALKHSWFTENF